MRNEKLRTPFSNDVQVPPTHVWGDSAPNSIFGRQKVCLTVVPERVNTTERVQTRALNLPSTRRRRLGENQVSGLKLISG